VDTGLFYYFEHASVVVQAVMLLLLLASILSWAIIVQRWFVLRRVRTLLQTFETMFWSGISFQQLYDDLTRKPAVLPEGLARIFTSGFSEWLRMQGKNAPTHTLLEAVQRAMRIAYTQELEQVEQHIPWLATIGSTSPYIGLLGTVCGIMTSFQALSTVQTGMTIGAVAPGISEALLTTALGLFAAIPAVIFYNRYCYHVDVLANVYYTFQEEFSRILYRQIHDEACS